MGRFQTVLQEFQEKSFLSKIVRIASISMENQTIQMSSALWNSSILTIGYPGLLFSNETDY